ncbi:MAG: aromatic ring-hydroxylating dioxygenase subunit alpha [Synechocystis sp.]|nr:aromatic ring-hydroxylating dioxygenase subunit alpha [Synechocystis sp.]
METLLRNFWYVALPSHALKAGKMVGKQMLGEKLLVGRRGDGSVFALRDICPHRGIPLSYGHLDNDQVCCCYHGWKFDSATGKCSEIPSLAEPETFKFDRVRVIAYPCQEVQGNIWVFMACDPLHPPRDADLPPVPTVPYFGNVLPQIAEQFFFNCHVDQAVIGLMDPAHGPYVHNAWWWRAGKHQFRIKEKAYEPTAMGFRLVPYTMPYSARPYKLLGQKVSIEIVFELPTVRVEILHGDRHTVCLLTVISPINKTCCEVHQSIYWTMPWLTPFKPLLVSLTRQFMHQDLAIVEKQQEGLAFDPTLMLIDDADTQAKWYFRLKQEYERAMAENRSFVNPLRPQILRWRS